MCLDDCPKWFSNENELPSESSASTSEGADTAAKRAPVKRRVNFDTITVTTNAMSPVIARNAVESDTAVAASSSLASTKTLRTEDQPLTLPSTGDKNEPSKRRRVALVPCD